MVQSSRLIDKDCASSDELLPALILAVIIYFKGLRHHIKIRGIIKDVASFILYCEKNFLSIVSGPGMTPSLASHCWRLFYFTHLSGRSNCIKDVSIV